MDRINYTNLPDQTTPINATNLNQMQENMDKVDTLRYAKTAIAENTDLNNLTDPRNIWKCYIDYFRDIK